MLVFNVYCAIGFCSFLCLATGDSWPLCDDDSLVQARHWSKLQRRAGAEFSLPFGYTILGPGHQVVARLLVPSNVDCPADLELELGDQVQRVAVQVRAEPHAGTHGHWYTEGVKYEYLDGINYTSSNPLIAFSYDDRVCEARFVPDFLGENLVASFHLEDQTVQVRCAKKEW